MAPQPKIQGTMIVLRGRFKPAMFQPSWFADEKLIRREEAAAAGIRLIHPAAAIFTASWLEVSVDEERFQLSTDQDAFYEPLRDLFIGVLNVVEDIQPKSLGLNHLFHYELPSERAWNRLGHRLVPMKDWEGVLQNPGTLAVHLQGVRPDRYSGHILVKVERSNKLEHGHYIEINDHYDLPSDPIEKIQRRQVQDLIARNWDVSVHRGLEIAEKVVGWGQEG